MSTFRPLVFLITASLILTSPPLRAEEEQKHTSEANKTGRKPHGPGLLNNLWNKVHPAKPKEEPNNASVTSAERKIGPHKVLLSMTLEPQPLSLSESRQLKVNLRVANQTKRLVQLEFPTTQRIEVLVHNSVGKLVEQWSEDRSFESEPGMVSINPGEHIEYSVTVATRDMAAGETYSVEALFPNYDPLRLQKNVTPVK